MPVSPLVFFTFLAYRTSCNFFIIVVDFRVGTPVQLLYGPEVRVDAFCLKRGLSAGFVILLLKFEFRHFFNNFNILAQKGQNGRKWPFSGIGGQKIESGHSGRLRGMPIILA